MYANIYMSRFTGFWPQGQNPVNLGSQACLLNVPTKYSSFKIS